MPSVMPSYAGADIVWALNVKFGGADHYVATETMVLDRDDGTSVSYTGGLTEPRYSETLSRFTHSKDALTISIEAIFDDLNIAEHRRKGFRLSDAVCELSAIFVVGGVIQHTYEGRVVVIDGLMSEPIYGQPDRPVGYVAFSIDSNPFEQTGPFLKSTMRLNDTSMQAFVSASNPLSEESDDKTYPLVFGSPGVYAGISLSEILVEGTPAYAISRTNVSQQARELLIAGHHVDAVTVTIFAKDNGSVEDLAVVNDYDLYRNPIAYVDISTESADFTKAEEFWVAWNGGSAVKNPFASSNVVNGAGDLMLWALSRTDFLVDQGAWNSARDYLNVFRFSGYLNDPEVTIWEWITEIAKYIPTLTIQNSPQGVYPIIQNMSSTTLDCISVSQGPDFDRDSGVTVEGEQADVVNTVTVEFAYDAAANTSKMYSVIGEADLTETQRFSSIHSHASISRYGIKESLVEAPYIYDRSTAELVAQAAVQMKGQLPETVKYKADTYYSFISLGDNLKLTDPELFLSEQICTVLGKAWDGDGWLFTLLIEDDIARDDRHF